MDDIKENYFEELQCPFTWNIHDIVAEAKVGMIDRLFQKNEEVSGQRWIKLLLSVATAYELYMNGEKSRAENELEKSIDILENEKKDEFLNKYNKAFQHVVYSVKLFFMRDNETAARINEVKENIPPYSKLSPEQKVAITGIKAYIIGEYGVPGSKHALELAREALKENPEEAEWSFMVGILLGRIRHHTLDVNITDEELRCMEDAYKQNRTSQNAVFLAQTYLDYAKYIRFAKKFVRDGKEMAYQERFLLNDEYQSKSYELYREALYSSTDNNCVHIKIRSINGLFKLIQFKVKHEKRPMRSEDLQELFSAVNECLEVAPDNTICNSIASKMYFALNDSQNGFKYAEKAAKCYGFFMAIIVKKMELNIKFDSEEIFKEVLTKYSNDFYLYQTYVFAMAYYIFQEYNISLMLKYFFMASEKNMKREDFNRYLIFTQSKVDVCPLVYNEVKLTVDRKKYKNEDELKQLEKALEIFHSLYPDVEEMGLEKDLKEKLQKRKRYKKVLMKIPKLY